MKLTLRPFLAMILVSAAAVAVACGSTTGGDTGGGATHDDGGTSGTDATTDGALADGAIDDAAADAGGDLFPADTTKIVVTAKGGFGAQGPDGSTCTLADATYTLVLPSRELSWKVCEYSDSGPFSFSTGSVTVSEADIAPLSAALHALRRQTKTGCGADKPEEQMVLSRPSGDVTYYDDFYFCDASDPKLYVTGMDAVISEMSKLAQH